MKAAYIAHPLSGDWENNCELARDFADHAARTGYAPVAPYLTLYGRLHEPEDRELGLSIDLALIERVDEFWLCGPRISTGMYIELRRAREVGLPIYRQAKPDTRRFRVR